jgi:hypothetical protein
LVLTWLDGTTWQITVPLGAGATTIQLEATTIQSAVVGTDSIAITNTSTTVPAAAGNLVISELMYHPANPTAAEIATLGPLANDDDFEYIELLNISANTVELGGATFASGVNYTFPAATLAAGARIILVRNATAFSARYGPGVAVFGTFDGKLQNDGERVHLLSSGGQTIVDFTYLGVPGWPAETDGAGFSLTLKNPTADPNESLASNWRVSTLPNGSPGGNDALEPGAFASPVDFAIATLPSSTLDPGQTTYTWTERIGADTASVQPQVSTNLVQWNPAIAAAPMEITINNDGTRTVVLPVELPAGNREYFRLEVIIDP